MQLPIHLDRTSALPLQDQLFEQIRRLIVSGKLKPHARIIATRFMAEQVGVSRTTVLLVYERLISEGYLVTRPTVGTFVSATVPDAPAHPPPAHHKEVCHGKQRHVRRYSGTFFLRLRRKRDTDSISVAFCWIAVCCRQKFGCAVPNA